MKQDKVLIIGGGLGGLQCGYILAKNGLQVTVLEYDANVGGYLQSFRRGKAIFDTGFHYIGLMNEDEPLGGIFKYMGLMDLPWCKLDEDRYDEIVIGDKSYYFANGYDNFINTLTEQFPNSRKELENYISIFRHVGDHMLDGLNPLGDRVYGDGAMFARSAYDWLNETITDPMLRKVLAAASLKLELNADTLPLYTYAQGNCSFLRSSWRLRGGGQQIADKLAKSIRNMGGEVLTRKRVTKILEKDGKVTGVEVNNSETYEGDWVISNLHPAQTVDLVGENSSMRRIYRNRIKRLENTFGMFTANIRLKEDAMPYLNYNLYIHKNNADIWRVDTTKTDSILVNYAVPDKFNLPALDSHPTSSTHHPTSAVSLDLLTPMHWDEVKQWADKPVGQRGDDYVEFKQRKTEECLSLVENRLPELRGAVDRIFTSTPLSYHSYTLSSDGAAYGIRKDYNNPMTTVLTPLTPIKNLLLTGQSLVMHGVLGVTMTSLLTCAEVIGLEKVHSEIKEYVNL